MLGALGKIGTALGFGLQEEYVTKVKKIVIDFCTHADQLVTNREHDMNTLHAFQRLIGAATIAFPFDNFLFELETRVGAQINSKVSSNKLAAFGTLLESLCADLEKITPDTIDTLRETCTKMGGIVLPDELKEKLDGFLAAALERSSKSRGALTSEYSNLVVAAFATIGTNLGVVNELQNKKYGPVLAEAIKAINAANVPLEMPPKGWLTYANLPP